MCPSQSFTFAECLLFSSKIAKMVLLTHSLRRLMTINIDAPRYPQLKCKRIGQGSIIFPLMVTFVKAYIYQWHLKYFFFQTWLGCIATKHPAVCNILCPKIVHCQLEKHLCTQAYFILSNLLVSVGEISLITQTDTYSYPANYGFIFLRLSAFSFYWTYWFSCAVECLFS